MKSRIIVITFGLKISTCKFLYTYVTYFKRIYLLISESTPGSPSNPSPVSTPSTLTNRGSTPTSTSSRGGATPKRRGRPPKVTALRQIYLPSLYFSWKTKGSIKRK